MNKTEARCLAWLLTQGYVAADITYQRRRSPVFLTPDGRAWEPKIARRGVITFTRKQLTQAHTHPDCTVVAWNDGRVPDLVPLTKLAAGYYGRYRLAIYQGDTPRPPLLAKPTRRLAKASV